MYSSFIKVGVRSIFKNKGYSFINITGLATGLAVAMLIGLWIWDELSHDRYHKNYDRIAFVMQHNLYNGEIGTQYANPYLLSEEIRNNFGSDFKYVLQSSWTMSNILSVDEKHFNKTGNYFEPGVIDMLSLKLVEGNEADAMKDPYSIIINASLARTLFDDKDPIGKTVRLNNKTDLKVTGVYEDLPLNSSFNDMQYILPWQLYLLTQEWIKKMDDPWGSNFTQTFAQLNDNADLEAVSEKIKNVKLNKVRESDRRYNPQVFLHPMSKWHLSSEFKNGVNIGGRIQFVWLFGIIGAFVLLLSCINFMNLSTARSEKRAKEVGVRKAIGSIRSQLIGQFFSESFLVVVFGFIISLGIVQIMLPFFNEVAGKKMSILWMEPVFWLLGIGFCIITGLVAGSYPALYLSSFQAARVLKGTYRAGSSAAMPRKVLVVVQFTVSITLIIGTIIVFQQIQFAKNRPIGYDRKGLIQMFMPTSDIHDHFDAVRTELKNQGAIAEMTESTSPTTSDWNTNGGFDWEGKDPAQAVDFPNNGVTPEYGKTVGWKFVQGRDFSRDFASDSSAFVLNEAAVRFIGYKNPIGAILKWNDRPYKVIGVIQDMIVQSPYDAVRPTLFHLSRGRENNIIIRLNPSLSAHESLEKIEATFKKVAPALPFDYTFVDEDYGKKFGDEERVGKLATFFTVLAVFISCLGIFGLASFTAEQRTKEIGIRKVLGASVVNLWQMLSRDFVVLVVIACLIAIPISSYFLSVWLMKYEYRTEITWWTFAGSAAGALIITLLTVSYQSIKAAVANPVNSLKSE